MLRYGQGSFGCKYGHQTVQTGMFFKLLLFGIIAGVGTYYYDLNSAEKKLRDAKFSSIETESRCRQNHESMCKYYMTVKLDGAEKLFYKYRVPQAYYHGSREEIQQRRFQVMYKEKKIFPARIVGLPPKQQADLDQILAQEQ